MKRAFVISPIGAEDSSIREHADDVFEFIISPAMETCGIEVQRADHLREPGMLSEQMFHSIARADLCIAVLTGANPNVYYELAVAQCLSCPTVILIHKGETLPFDIKDLRCVWYDLSLRKVVKERTYTSEIVDYVRRLETLDWKVRSPLEAIMRPAQSSDIGELDEFFVSSRTYRNSTAWRALLDGTQSVFDTMGISRSSWKRDPGFGRVLQEKAEAGCRAGILLMASDNPVMPYLLNTSSPEVMYDTLLHDLDVSSRYFAQLQVGSPGIECRQMRHGYPRGQLTLTDNVAVYIPYLFSKLTADSPLLACGPNSALYAVLKGEFEALWQDNAPGSDEVSPQGGESGIATSSGSVPTT